MSNCCDDKSCEIAGMAQRHAHLLWIVLAINAVMFVVEGTVGILARSTSLLADSLDMLGDALVYGFTLFVLARSARWQAGAALTKGLFMLAFGLAVLAQAAYRAFNPEMPSPLAIGVVGSIALIANLACFGLLYAHRADNLNMRSTWLCSRNDLFANVGVLFAAAGSYWFASHWPDLLVGTAIAAMFLHSAYQVCRDALRALRAPPAASGPVAVVSIGALKR